MKDLKKDILNQIKQEHITPVSKKMLKCKKILLYIFLILSVVIGAISFAIMLGYLLEADWFLTHRLGLMKVFGSFLPVFWLLFLVVAVAIGYGEFSKTERGYKFYFWQIILGNVVVSLTLGTLLYFSGISQFIENTIQENLPQYREVLVGDKVSRMKEVWQNEEAGLLIGEVIESNGENFLLQDSNKKIWEITTLETTNIKHQLKLEAGEKIKLIGKKIEENSFQAEEIRPFIGKGLKGEY